MPGEALPILVGVTGKRDLAGRDEAVRRALTALFDALERAFPASPKVLVTGLAEGSDMLATEVALARPHWRVAGLLAFAEPDFIARFTGGDAARATFTRVTAHPRLRKITLAPLADSQPAGPSRGDSYEQLGLWLARNTAILIGVMPADEAEDRLGGTARVLGHRCRGTVDEPAMAVQHRSLEVAAPLPLDPPEPQPACILDLAGAADARGALPVLLRTLDSTAAQRDTPLALAPDALRRTFDQAAAIEAYNRCIGATPRADWPENPPTADALIGRFRSSLSAVQRRHQSWWQRSTVMLASLFFLAVLMLEIFAKFEISRAAPAYAVVVLMGLVVYRVASLARWQSVHQDYRAVNEVLRVQRAWWAAGLHAASDSADRHILRGAAGALLRVRRGAGAMLAWARLATAPPAEDPAAVQRWIAEQQAYFARSAHRREGQLRAVRLTSWGAFFLALGLGLWLAVYGAGCTAWLGALAHGPAPVAAGLAGLAILLVGSRLSHQAHGASWGWLAFASGAALIGFVVLGSLLYGPASQLLDRPAKTPVVVALVLLLALAGAIRFVAEKLVWEAEAHAYEEAHARFAAAARAWGRIDTAGLPPVARDARRQDLARDLGCRALAESEAWLRAHRERPTEPMVGG